MNRPSLEKAKEYAFLLLKFRQRSEKELFERLKKKNFRPETIKEALAFLKEKAFIDDDGFTRAWLSQRLKKPYGLRRILRELSLKGIARERAEAAFGQIKEDYNEKEIVARVAKERLARLSGLEPLKAKKRLFAYLLRRGFSPEIIRECLNKSV